MNQRGDLLTYAVVTCELKLFWNNFEIISLLYFTRNRVWNCNKIISAAERFLEFFSKLFQRQIDS